MSVGTRRRLALLLGSLATTTVAMLAMTGCSSVAVPASSPAATSKSDARKLDTTPEPDVLGGVTNVTKVAQLTGPKSMNTTARFDVAGQDLGSMFRADGKTWFVFGDTFGQRDDGMTGGGGTEWRSNSLAYSTDTDPTNGITFDGYIADSTGASTELISSKKIDNTEMTTIPTYGFAANGAMYLDYMSVKHWGDPGEWETNYAGLAKSTDEGKTWKKLAAPRWGGTSNFVQVSETKVGSDLYFWGVTHGRFGGVQLMKVPERSVEDKAAYRYFAGTDSSNAPVWSADESTAKTIVDDTVGELSVVWNSYLERWIMSYTNGGSGDTSLRESSTPWGLWGTAHTLVSSSQVPGLYAPFMSSQYVTHGGKTIYFGLSEWDPYNVFWFKADLVKKN
jgi:hypothetical protein